MRGGEYQVSRDRGPAAKALLASEHHHRMRKFRRGLRAADHCGGGSCQRPGNENGRRARHRRVMSRFSFNLSTSIRQNAAP